ncbi:D-alanyl-D-alanine carboxypeptidase/D-alanyl-D-alanine endopeptidase [Sphingomonas echinoides]|uniref:D-alanyl-D-alanine carboxypeptidase/D-alanyl-D-alanine-endopeptidase n=1 Tax=Sphingomonas echinoides TaxID=59803 RepID=A0ABU4PPU3_9SPHN|nr:D-alanyl-D-alanine carboxypeptidase/D-alanyl-D-alanine-endopeptidase [Sphingomonas echinoides]MDX5985148.1 D-alanyl-D-alanine carboxypeptidase/D-alanyl-D-alanine-endopeptidase [Sphingomonas echinoides]
MHRALVPPFVLLLVAALPTALHAQSALQSRVEDVLRSASPGTRFGLVVADETGTEIVAINPDQRFIPASNTKMFTTAAAFWSLGALDQPDEAGGAAVRIDQTGKQRDVILEGHGDARLSSAPACTVDCLATLADAVAAKTGVVRDVVGDDSLYPDERWSPGMSWNNIPTKSGTATSALTLDDNELPVAVTPSTPGRPPTVTLPPYYTLENGALTTATGATTITFDRAPNGTVVRLGGTIAVASKPEPLRLGIDDPAHYAAWMLRNMLVARGVRVTGDVSVRHRPLTPADDPAIRGSVPAARPPAPAALARLTPPPLIEDLTLINKVSQNLHAELMLRRVALKHGSGSIADGQVAVRAMLAEAGVPRVAFDFADGSGMSSYNRVTPRGVVTFLRWVSAQPWGTAWRATLPVGGEGTLTRRFAGTALDHRLFAKTGTLNATNALSGYMVTKSGRMLTMAFYANDVPEGASATRAMDAALLLIASQN